METKLLEINSHATLVPLVDQIKCQTPQELNVSQDHLLSVDVWAEET